MADGAYTVRVVKVKKIEKLEKIKNKKLDNKKIDGLCVSHQRTILGSVAKREGYADSFSYCNEHDRRRHRHHAQYDATPHHRLDGCGIRRGIAAAIQDSKGPCFRGPAIRVASQLPA